MSCKALALYSEEVFLTYNGERTEKRIVLQNIFSELKEDERRRRELPGGNDRLMSESDAEIGKKMKKSSLTSLRKDNEVKLEDEIKLVCNEYK